MEESEGSGNEEYESLRLPLPEAPVLGLRGTWESEHPLVLYTVLVVSGVASLGMLAAAFAQRAYRYVFATNLAILLASMMAPFVLSWIAARRAKRLRSEFPLEPWRYDRPWDARGERRWWLVRMAALAARIDLRFAQAGLVVLGVAFGVAGHGRLVAVGFLGGTLASWIAWTAWRVQGAGDAYLAFAKFPFHPGERVTLRFGMSSGGATFRRVEFRLSRVAPERPTSDPAPVIGVRKQSMSEFRPPGALPGSDFYVEVSFDLPADARGTRLSRAKPEYWILDVLGATSSGPYAESFLVPIYARPEPPATEPVPA